MMIHLAIIALSAALFAYWFRCSCLLILRAQTSEDYTSRVIVSAQLTISETLSRLEDGLAASLKDVRRALDRDYVQVCRLLDVPSDRDACLSSVECVFLKMDYWLLRAVSRACGETFPSKARAAMREMGAIVQCFANAAGSTAGA